jgi:ArsR family transcriptional regulator, nickel/cobalt-responsive transcriptional repressor
MRRKTMAAKPAVPVSKSCADLMRALADHTRLEVVKALLDGPLHVHELNAALQVEPTLFSHHLRVLRDARILVARRDGKAVLYSLAPAMTSANGGRTIDLKCCDIRFN